MDSEALGLIKCMRVCRTIIVLLFLTVFVIGLRLFWPDSHYRFRHRSKEYYAAFTKACDALLEQNPLGTNWFIEVPTNAAHLPQIIQDFQPLKITVASNKVWILPKGGDFGISWVPQDEPPTNVWLLITSKESHVRIVYSAQR